MSQKILLILLCLLSSCKWGIDLDYSQRLPKGNWRGSIETPIGELPFLFSLEVEDSSIVGAFSGSEEDLSFDEVVCLGDSLFVSAGIIKMRFRIAGSAADSLKGEISTSDKQWTKCVAAYGEKYKFIARSRAFTSSLNGVWQLIIDGEDETLIELEEGATDLFAYYKEEVKGPGQLSGIKDAKKIMLSGISKKGCILLQGQMKDKSLRGTGWDGSTFNWEAKSISSD